MKDSPDWLVKRVEYTDFFALQIAGYHHPGPTLRGQHLHADSGTLALRPVVIARCDY